VRGVFASTANGKNPEDFATVPPRRERKKAATATPSASWITYIKNGYAMEIGEKKKVERGKAMEKKGCKVTIRESLHDVKRSSSKNRKNYLKSQSTGGKNSKKRKAAILKEWLQNKCK